MARAEPNSKAATMPKRVVSEARLRANRENARRSTGPRTAAGKARSSRNAVTHGITACQVDTARSSDVVPLPWADGQPRSSLGNDISELIGATVVRLAKIAEYRRQRLEQEVASIVSARPELGHELAIALATACLIPVLNRLADYARKLWSRLDTALRNIAVALAFKPSTDVGKDPASARPATPTTADPALAKQSQSAPIRPDSVPIADLAKRTQPNLAATPVKVSIPRQNEAKTS